MSGAGSECHQWSVRPVLCLPLQAPGWIDRIGPGKWTIGPMATRRAGQGWWREESVESALTSMGRGVNLY